MMPKVFDKDIGTLIQLETYVDLITADEVAILASDPNGVESTLTAVVISGPLGNSMIQHTKDATTLNIAGNWILQAHAVFTDDLEFHGQKVSIPIGEAITP